MIFIRNSIIILIILSVFVSCKKDKHSIKAEGEIEFYLLKSYNTLDNSFMIDESTVITNNEALIKYSDIKSYEPETYMFVISEESKNYISNLEQAIDGLAFALKANGNVIYTGYFFPSYSSMICDWVVIDPIGIEYHNELKVKLGYPRLSEEMTIPDNRNNELILAILKRDNKLIE